MADLGAPLHIIEPTLATSAGHCHSFVSSLCLAGEASRFELWAGRDASLPELEGMVRVHRHFRRHIRRFQAFWLYRRLLRQAGRLFIATAGRTDLLLLDLAANGAIPPGKVFLYIHWLYLNDRKRAELARIARKQPALTLLAPTESVAAELYTCGFQRVMTVPYPITPQKVPAGQERQFRHLLFAGAARADKGIAHVVTLLETMAREQADIPLVIQTAADHFNRYDDTTRQALDRLSKLSYPELLLVPETLSADHYQQVFAGAICLQLYNRADFADRISGITLDALSNGAPLLTLDHTWMARLVERFDAGRVVADTQPELLLKAIREIMADYPGYCRKAAAAGAALQQENSARHLFEVLTG